MDAGCRRRQHRRMWSRKEARAPFVEPSLPRGLISRSEKELRRGDCGVAGDDGSPDLGVVLPRGVLLPPGESDAPAFDHLSAIHLPCLPSSSDSISSFRTRFVLLKSCLYT
eukprot:6269456-Prymnesium_polylepis.1